MDNKILAILIGIVTVSILGSFAYAMNSTLNTSLNTSIKTGVVSTGVSVKLKAWTNQSVLTSAYAAVGCRTAFAGAMINQTVAADPGLSFLNGDMLALSQDNAHLQTYIAGSDVVGFTTYLHAVYDPQVLGLYVKGRDAIIADHNLTLSEKLALGNDFTTGLSAYSNCVAGPLVNLSEDKLSFYNGSQTQFGTEESILSSNGVNTENMTIVLQGAQTQIVAPYQAAIEGNSNSTQIWAAINTYCLYNGCPSGMNYHLDAKFTIAKLDAIDAKLATVSNDTTDLSSAQASLNAASSQLTKVGDSYYSAGAGVRVWTNITSAEVSLHSAFSKLNG